MALQLADSDIKSLIEGDYFLVVLDENSKMIGKISLKELLEYIKNGSY